MIMQIHHSYFIIHLCGKAYKNKYFTRFFPLNLDSTVYENIHFIIYYATQAP